MGQLKQAIQDVIEITQENKWFGELVFVISQNVHDMILLAYINLHMNFHTCV